MKVIATVAFVCIEYMVVSEFGLGIMQVYFKGRADECKYTVRNS